MQNGALFKKSKNRISGLDFIHKARRHVIFLFFFSTWNSQFELSGVFHIIYI